MSLEAAERFLVHRDLDDRALSAAYAAGRVAWDIETTGLNWRLDRIATVQVHIPSFGTTIVRMDGSVPDNLRDLLAAEIVQKVFHYAPFDLRFMRNHWKAVARNVACTKVASRILFPELPTEQHSLASLAQRFLNVSLDKTERTSNWESPFLTPAQLRYAAGDVEHLISLAGTLLHIAVANGLAGLIEASWAYLPVRVETDIRECGDIFAYAK